MTTIARCGEGIGNRQWCLARRERLFYGDRRVRYGELPRRILAHLHSGAESKRALDGANDYHRHVYARRESAVTLVPEDKY